MNWFDIISPLAALLFMLAFWLFADCMDKRQQRKRAMLVRDEEC